MGAADRYDGVYSWGERLVAFVSWLGASAVIAWFSSAYNAVAAEGWGAVALIALFGGPILLFILLALLTSGVAAWRWITGQGHVQKVAIDRGEYAPAAAHITEPWGNIELSLPGFVFENNPQEPGTHILKAEIGAKKGSKITRIAILFKSKSQSNSLEITTYSLPKNIANGEQIRIIVLHYSSQFGAIWGSAALYPLDDITRTIASREPDNRLSLFSSISCRIVVSAEAEEDLVYEFTIYTGGKNDLPQIVDPAWHRPYESANRSGEGRSTKRFL